MKRKLCLIIAMIMAVTALMTGCSAGGSGSSGNYKIYLYDQDGKGVSGATIQLCTDRMCMTGVTDKKGCAKFDTEPGAYTVHILETPDGYTDDTAYTTDPGSSKIEIYEKTGEEPAAEDETGTGAAAEPEDYSSIAVTKCPDYVKEVSGNIKKLKFSTVDIDGNAFTSDDLKGYDLVVINFFESWCHFCVEELPDLEAISQNYKDKNVLVVGVYKDPVYSKRKLAFWKNTLFSDVDQLRQQISDAGVDYPVIAYTKAFDRYASAMSRPCTFIVDGDGNVYGITKDEIAYVYECEGASPEDAEEIAGQALEGPEGTLDMEFDYLGYATLIEDRLD